MLVALKGVPGLVERVRIIGEPFGCGVAASPRGAEGQGAGCATSPDKTGLADGVQQVERGRASFEVERSLVFSIGVVKTKDNSPRILSGAVAMYART